MPDPKWFPKVRKSIKALPTKEELQEKRRLQFQIEQRAMHEAHRRERLWKLRTQTYQTNINGVFMGSYQKPTGQTILVRGNTRAEIRYEAVKGANPLRWIRVGYEAPDGR